MKTGEAVVAAHGTGSPYPSQWDPRSWSRRAWLILVTALIVIVIVIVGAVVGVRATRNNSPDGTSSSYPDYTQLNYTLIDTCKLKWLAAGALLASSQGLGVGAD
jgi:hypothetical protein